MTALSISLISYYNKRVDGPRVVAQELQQRLAPGEIIYTGNYHHITYHLLEQESPTPYVHASLLFYPHHVEALEIDLDKEADRILSQNPRFILLRPDHPRNRLTDIIYNQYIVSDTLLNDKVLVLEKRTYNE